MNTRCPLNLSTRTSVSSRASMAGKGSIVLLATLVLSVVLLGQIGLGVYDMLAEDKDFTAQQKGSVSAVSDSAALIDIAVLQNFNLFPAASSTSLARTSYTPLTIDADETSLNLRLEGVALASSESASMAFILSNGSQGSYRIGDPLPAGNRVVLERVFKDYVIINNSGELESLWLYEGERTGGGSNGTLTQSAAPSDQRALIQQNVQKVVSSLGLESRGEMAAKLSEIVQVVPAQNNGNLIGYRLSPGSNLKEFVKLGFKTSDVVTAVNEIPLNDMANLPKLMDLMKEESEFSFAIVREGQPLTLQVALASSR